MRAIKITVALILISGLTFQYQPERKGLNFTAVYAQTAGSLTISWTPPVQFTDGAPLLEQELDYYTFYCDGASVAIIDSVIGQWTADVNTAALAEGSHTCHLTVTAIGGPPPTIGAESGPSNSINFTIGPRVPMAPAGLTSI